MKAARSLGIGSIAGRMMSAAIRRTPRIAKSKQKIRNQDRQRRSERERTGRRYRQSWYMAKWALKSHTHSANGTVATSQDGRWTSAFGARAVSQRTSLQ